MNSPVPSGKRKADVLTPQHNPRTKSSNTNSNTTSLLSLSSLSVSSDEDIFNPTSTIGGSGNLLQRFRAIMPSTSNAGPDMDQPLPDPGHVDRDTPPHLANGNRANTAPPSIPPTYVPNHVRFTNAPPNTQGDIHITPSHIFEKWSTDDKAKFEQFLTEYTILAHLPDDWPGSDLNMSRDVLHQLLSIAGGLDNPRTRFGGLEGIGKRNIRRDLTYCRWFYLTGLTKEQYERLTKSRRVWNCDFGTMVTHPWPLPVTGFATTISGLSARSVDREEVTNAVKNGIYTNKLALEFIASNKADNLKTLFEGMAEELLYKVAESAKVVPRDPPTTSPTTAPTQWAVYTIPVTTRSEFWEEWINIIGSIPIETDIGEGNKHGANKIHCQICQSLDHTREYCYYPKVDGWVAQVKLAEERPNKTGPRKGNNGGTRDNRRGGKGGNRRGKPY